MGAGGARARDAAAVRVDELRDSRGGARGRALRPESRGRGAGREARGRGGRAGLRARGLAARAQDRRPHRAVRANRRERGGHDHLHFSAIDAPVLMAFSSDIL